MVSTAIFLRCSPLLHTAVRDAARREGYGKRQVSAWLLRKLCELTGLPVAQAQPGAPDDDPRQLTLPTQAARPKRRRGGAPKHSRSWLARQRKRAAARGKA